MLQAEATRFRKRQDRPGQAKGVLPGLVVFIVLIFGVMLWVHWAHRF